MTHCIPDDRLLPTDNGRLAFSTLLRKLARRGPILQCRCVTLAINVIHRSLDHGSDGCSFVARIMSSLECLLKMRLRRVVFLEAPFQITQGDQAGDLARSVANSPRQFKRTPKLRLSGSSITEQFVYTSGVNERFD